MIVDRKWTISNEEWHRRKTEAPRRWFARQRQRKARATTQAPLAGRGEETLRRADSDCGVGHPVPAAKLSRALPNRYLRLHVDYISAGVGG